MVQDALPGGKGKLSEHLGGAAGSPLPVEHLPSVVGDAQ